jgi:chromate reductase
MDKKIKIVGIAGSLRKEAYSKAVLNAAKELTPESTEFEICGIEEIPPFNQDNENNLPISVKEIKAKLMAADAIVIVTPEYNFSFPGVLKNAIDALSRNEEGRPANPFDSKPIAIMSNSPYMLGGSRAYYQLRQVFVYLNANVLNRPEVIIPFVKDKLDKNGRLSDEETRGHIKKQLEALLQAAMKKSA